MNEPTPGCEARTIREGRVAYFADNELPPDGGYQEKWVKLKFLGIPFAFPNTEARKRQVPAHDVHHLLTGYRTDVVGEAEIGAFEIGSVCDGPARHLALRVIGIVLLWAPRRVFRAFVRGRNARNYYTTAIDDALLDRSVADARSELGLDAHPPHATAADRVAFIAWCAAAIAVAWWPLVLFVVIWRW